MAIADISVVPLGTETPSVSKYIAKAVKVLQKEKDMKYELTPMGTIIEADLDKILLMVKQMHEVIFDEGIVRVVTTVKIDDRRDKVTSMHDKVQSVKRELRG